MQELRTALRLLSIVGDYARVTRFMQDREGVP
jgi:hypothetical protein